MYIIMYFSRARACVYKVYRNNIINKRQSAKSVKKKKKNERKKNCNK